MIVVAVFLRQTRNDKSERQRASNSEPGGIADDFTMNV